MDFLGFYSMRDFLISIFGFWTKKNFFLMSSIIFGFASINQFITDWVWNDPKQIWIFIAVIIGDWVAGIAKGAKSKKGFKMNLALRILPKTAVYVIIFSAVNSSTPQINATIYGIAIGVNLVSFIKNCAAIGLIKGRVAELIIKYLEPEKENEDES